MKRIKTGEKEVVRESEYMQIEKEQARGYSVQSCHGQAMPDHFF